MTSRKRVVIWGAVSVSKSVSSAKRRAGCRVPVGGVKSSSSNSLNRSVIRQEVEMIYK